MFKNKPLLKTLILFLLSMSFVFTSQAYNFSSTASSGQTLYFNILSDSTVAVTYPHFSSDSYYSGHQRPTGNLIIPSAVSNSGSIYQVVSIGDNAFNSCSGLLSVTIPTSVTSIGNNAFMGCTALSSLAIPNSVTMVGVGSFQGCSGLQSIYLGSSISTIGNVAFEGCSSVTSLSIPNSVTLIGNWAFCNCTSLDSLYIGSSVTYILQNTFAGTSNVRYLHYNAKNAIAYYSALDQYYSALPVGSLVHLEVGDSVQTLQQYTFSGADSLESVYLGKNLSSVSTSAFSGCSNVRHLTYNSGLFGDATYPSDAFSVFSALTHLVVGNDVSHIPASAFSLHDSLHIVQISPSVYTLGDSCFFSCTRLTNLQLPNTLSSIGASAFQGCSSLSGTLSLPLALSTIGENAFRGCTALSGTLSFPSALTAVGQGAFYGCTNLTALNSQNSSAPIPPYAFYNCQRLYQVVLGNQIPSIGSSAFRGCIRLTDLTLGSSVASVGPNAFSGCVRLPNPVFPSSLTTLGDSVFYGCSLVGGQLSLPQAISYIGNYAFANTAPISLISIKAATPPTIFAATFSSATLSTPVSVPCGSLLSYQVANVWDDFNNLSEATPYDLSLSVNDTLMGTIVVLQQPTCSNFVARIQASAFPGYHFIRWNDGNTANPRQLTLSSDTGFVAFFVSDYSYVTVLTNDTIAGSVTGSGLYSYNDSVFLTAYANPGFHFQYWNDGNTANPRLLFPTQDTTFTAIFLSNTSTIAVSNNNPTMGSVSGGGTYYYQNQAVITATPFYGYHFTSWNDGVTSNPRTILVSQDSTFIANFAVNIYNVSASSSNPTMGSVLGGGNYNYLSSATLTATANYGYHFTQWVDGSTDNPRSLVVTSDSSFVAQFVANSYTLSVTSADTTMGSVFGGGNYSYNNLASISAIPTYGYHFVQWSDGDTANPRQVAVLGNASYAALFAINNYTVSVTSANAAMGTTSGSGNFAHGAVAYISASPSYGYHFVQWSDGNTDNPRLITVTQNASYVAQFAVNSYGVSVSANNPALGTVSGGGNFMYNTQTVISATPFYGFYFVQWSDGNTDNPRTLTVTSDLSLVAQFDSVHFSLSASSTNYAAGNVLGSGSYPYLSQVTLTAVPMPHYHFVQWSDSVTANPRVVTLTSDTAFVAQFALDTHQVLVYTNDSIQGIALGSGTWPYGTATYISAQPNYGYHFTSWNDGSTLNPRRVVVNSDTAFTAIFGYNVYTLQAPSNDTSLGVTSGSGRYNYLSSVILSATPVGNSRFVGWSDGVLDNPRTVTVISDTILTANFKSNACEISCRPNDSTLGAVRGSGIFNYLNQVFIDAVPNSHCHFVSWSDGETSNPRLITVLHDSSFTAIFQPDTQFFVTVQSSNDTLGTTTGQGYYYYGDQALLTALPAERARFVQWSDGIKANPRVVQVISDAQYTAIFAPQTFSVVLSANYPSLGALYGAGEYPYGQQVTLTAVPFPEVEFLGWSDSITDNPRTIVVTGDTSFHALFHHTLGIGDPAALQCLISTSGRTIRVDGVADRSVALFDLYGRRIAAISQSGNTVTIPVLAAGVYLVQVEGCRAQKVVVM